MNLTLPSPGSHSAVPLHQRAAHHFPFCIQCLIVAATFCAIAAWSVAQTVPPPKKPPVERAADVEVTTHIVKPLQLPPPDVKQLRVPDGFKIEVFARDLGNARMLAIGPEGRVYVTRREQGDVLMLEPDGNGLAKGPPKRVASRPNLHGIAFHSGKVYLATIKEVYRADVQPDGSFGPLEMIIHDLPDAGQHPTRTVQVGPDGMLYIGVGSTTNEANEPNPESATILRASLDGKHRSIFASGLRDVIGWGWQPGTGELWGMDHGIDWLGDEVQPEELNRIEKGKRYGWPFVYADDQFNPHADPPPGLEKSEILRASTPMVMGYTAHAGPMQLSFYTTGGFPQEYWGDAFVSMRGSWNRKPPSGYEVVRIRFRNGQPVKFEPFVTGFVSPEGERGRLAGNVIARDGSLLFTDDRNGVIYRVSYTGAGAMTGAPPIASVPAGPMRQQSREGITEPLAHQASQMHADAKLEINSPAFHHNGLIPPLYSAYEQNISPALRWSGAPKGTRSFALLMEDPDASITPLPVVHWLAWNIPGGSHELREAIPPADRLRDPDGMRQGVNVGGKVGYTGPKPPAGDKPHRYFVQIFALDTELDLPVGADRQQLLMACAGHVLAVGVLQGSFARPDNPTRP